MRRGRPRTDALTRISPTMCWAYRGPRRITFHIPAPVGAPPWTPGGLFRQTVSWMRNDPPTRHRVLLARQLSPARCRSHRPPASSRQPADERKSRGFPGFFVFRTRLPAMRSAGLCPATVRRAADAAGQSPALRGSCSRPTVGSTRGGAVWERKRPGFPGRFFHLRGLLAVIRPPGLPPSASRAAAGGHAWRACPGRFPGP